MGLLTCKLNSENEATFRFYQELVRREAVATSMMLRNQAETLFETLMGRIPKREEYEVYRDSLGLHEVRGAPKGTHMLAVVGTYKPGKMRAIDTPRSVLYIRPKQAGSQVPKGPAILKKYEPWTVATLPYEPPEEEADVIARRVSVNEVATVDARARSFIPKVNSELKAAGVMFNSRAAGAGIERGVTFDLAYMGLRMEYGLEGYEYLPHWRPAIRAALDPAVLVDRQVEMTLQDPNYRGWKAPLGSLPVAGVGDLENLSAFQNKIL